MDLLAEDDVDKILQMLNDARGADESVQVRRCYRGNEEIKTYRFRAGFPNGPKKHSVTAWYSVDSGGERHYMSNGEFANYISAALRNKDTAEATYEIKRIRR